MKIQKLSEMCASLLVISFKMTLCIDVLLRISRREKPPSCHQLVSYSQSCILKDVSCHSSFTNFTCFAFSKVTFDFLPRYLHLNFTAFQWLIDSFEVFLFMKSLVFIIYFLTDQQRKENILDKFIHSLRSLENNNPTNQQLCEEQTSPVRKSSFFDQFFEAILAGHDTNEAAESRTIEKEAHDPTPNLTVTPVAVTSEDDFTFVKTLPKERKISLMMSIFNRLTTKQEDSAGESDLKKDDYRTLDDIGEGDGRGMMEKIQQNSEIDNQGHKLTPAVDLEEFETESSQYSPDVSKDDRKALPSVASDIESTPLQKAKTARAWFKDPHLYKVT